MNATISSIINILVIILVFGIIIMIHELGHFLMCKWTGIGEWVHVSSNESAEKRSIPFVVCRSADTV